MPTLRQKLAFEKTIENNGNVSKSMRESGYSKSHSCNPQILTNSKGFQKLLNKYAPERDLIVKATKMLEQCNIEHKDFPASLSIDIIKELFKKSMIEVLHIEIKPNEKTTVYFKQVDALTQDKALDKLLRLHGLYAPDKHDHRTTGLSLVDLYDMALSKRMGKNN